MKYKIEIAPLLDYFVIAAKDKKTGELVEAFTINESGKDMLELFCQEKDTITITQEIADKYEAPLEQVSIDVAAFTKRLTQKGLL